MGTIFMTIRNGGKSDDALLSASVDREGVTAEIHDVKNHRMMKVEKIALPGKSSLVLKRGGMHIMLFNLPITAKEGQEFTVTLKFERAGEKSVKVKFSGVEHDMHGH